MSKTIEAIKALAEPALARLGYELVEVEYRKEQGRYVLRLFIDIDRGINLDDCEAASRAVGAELDQADVIPHSYNLEVSSPGLERPLKKEADFLRFTGQNATINTYAPQGGRRRFKGRLMGLEAGMVRLATAEGTYELPLKDISAARLSYDFKGDGGGK